MQLTRLNVEIVPTSAWALVRGPAHELDRTQGILGAWSAQLARGEASRRAPRGQAVWLRQGPEELAVLLGALLAVGQQVQWQRGLPSYPEAAVYRDNVAAQRALPSHDPDYLHDYQASAVLAALMAPWGRGILSVPTAGGKTRIACSIARGAGGSWVYLAPNLELARQTQAEAPASLQCFSFGTADPGALAAADGVIIDECHRIAANTYSRVLMRARARWRIGMSGTPLLRSDHRNALVVGLLGPVVYSIEIEKLTTSKAISSGVVRSVVI